MSFFDNLGRDLFVFATVGSVVTMGQHGTHYEFLVIPAMYVVVGIFVDIRNRRCERMQPIKQTRLPEASRAYTTPANTVAAPAIKPKPHIRLKHPNAKTEPSELVE